MDTAFIPELRVQAAEALMALIQSGKVSAGDLIKIIGMEEDTGGGTALCRDFVIRVTEEGGTQSPSDPNRAPDGTPDRDLDSIPDRVTDSTPDRVTDRALDRAPDRTPGSVPGTVPDKESGTIPDKEPDTAPDKVPDTEPYIDGK